jgi:glycosyltransferase 2 family protein
MPKRQTLLNLARILISIGLLTWVLLRVGVSNLLTIFATLDWGLYALALGLSTLSMGLRAYRWWLLLDAVQVRVNYWRVVYLYYIGAFYNTFLPTGFGGDVMRVVEFGRGASSSQAAGTVIVDRLTGFVMLFVLALAALPFTYHLLPEAMRWALVGVSVSVILGAALLFEGRLLRRLTARFPHALSLAGDAWLGRTYAVITACGWKAIALALFWSLMFNLLHIGASALVGLALGLSVPISVYFVFVPLATVALLIPITVNGLGFRESIYLALFPQTGVSGPQATAFSLGTYSLDLLDGLVGGLIYLMNGVLKLWLRR